MDNEKYQMDVTKRLDVIIKLLAMTALKDSSVTDKIYFLNKSGFSPKEIADILNTTSNYVNVILSNMRKKEKKNIANETKDTEVAKVDATNSEGQNG